MDEQEWPEVERRRELNVTVAHLSNGVKKAAWAALGLLATGVVSGIGWGVRTTITDYRQNDAIAQVKESAQVRDQAIAEGTRALSRADTAFLNRLREVEEESDKLLQRIIWIEAVLDPNRGQQ